MNTPISCTNLGFSYPDLDFLILDLRILILGILKFRYWFCTFVRGRFLVEPEFRIQNYTQDQPTVAPLVPVNAPLVPVKRLLLPMFITRIDQNLPNFPLNLVIFFPNLAIFTYFLVFSGRFSIDLVFEAVDLVFSYVKICILCLGFVFLYLSCVNSLFVCEISFFVQRNAEMYVEFTLVRENCRRMLNIHAQKYKMQQKQTKICPKNSKK